MGIELSKKATQRLPLHLNVLGFLFIRKSESEFLGSFAYSLTKSEEIAGWIRENTGIKTEKAKQTLEKVLQKLERKGLIFSLTEKAQEIGYFLSPGKYYAVSPSGEEVMRFVPPYMDLFTTEMLIPTPLKEANLRLSLLLRRKNFLGPSQLKRICLIRKFGDRIVAFRKISAKEVIRIFHDFPYVKFKEFATYFDYVNIPLTGKVIACLANVFTQKEEMPWREVSQNMIRLTGEVKLNELAKPDQLWC